MLPVSWISNQNWIEVKKWMAVWETLLLCTSFTNVIIKKRLQLSFSKSQLKRLARFSYLLFRVTGIQLYYAKAKQKGFALMVFRLCMQFFTRNFITRNFRFLLQVCFGFNSIKLKWHRNDIDEGFVFSCLPFLDH